MNLRILYEYLQCKKKSMVFLTDLPVEIILMIYNHIESDDLISRIHFLHVLLRHDKNSIYKYELKLNCLMAQVCNITNFMLDDILFRIRHCECNAYVFMQWSPFSKEYARPIAKIWWSYANPHKRVWIYKTQLCRSAKRSIAKGCLQARLSVHYDAEESFDGFVKCQSKFKTYYFHPMPMVTCVADANQQSIVSNGSALRPCAELLYM